MNRIEKIQRLLVSAMNLRREESFLVVTDPDLREVGELLLEAGRAAGGAAHLLVIPGDRAPGSEPDPLTAAAMKAARAVVCPTRASLTHTRARREACAAGARVATMPGIDLEILLRAAQADAEAVAARTRNLAERLRGKKQVRLTNPLGTDLTLSMEGRRVIASEGLIREPGAGGNLPSGEVYFAPVEGTTQGTLVVDGSFAGLGKLSRPVRLTFREGIAREIEGGEEARRLEALLEPHGGKARNAAELGIGANDAARISGNVLEDEKVLGTVHVALGNNLSMGGSVDVPLHLDGVLTRPTLEIDGEVYLRDGVPQGGWA